MHINIKNHENIEDEMGRPINTYGITTSGVDNVIKHGVRVTHVRSSRQTVSDYAIRQWFPNTQQSWFLTACRRLEKLVLPSIFDTSLSSLMYVKLAVIQQQFWMKKMGRSDPVRGEFPGSPYKYHPALGIKTYSDPSYILSGVKTPRIYASVVTIIIIIIIVEFL